MNILLLALYVVFAVAGSTLIKYGGLANHLAGFMIPLVNVRISLITLAGIVGYGLSFVIYIILLNRMPLSVVSPVTIGLVYVLLMATAVFVFQEEFSIIKIIGCVMVLVGVMLVIIGR